VAVLFEYVNHTQMILFIAVEKSSRQKCSADVSKRILLYQFGNLFNMEETHRFSAVIQKEGKWYVSWCPKLDIASQGETIEEAIKNLKESIELYLEDEDIQIPAASQIFTTTIEVSVG
jgi:predicted RNase H-like HicB family nuclease